MKRVHPAAIGMFIAGAAVLLFGSVIVLGSGRLFRETREFLLTFRESAPGLEVDAPVKLMGVTVGRVKEFAIEGSAKTDAFLLDVVVEIDYTQSKRAFRDPIDLDNRARFEQVVGTLGLRGQLEIQSLLSGQLCVALNLFPGEEGFQLHKEQEHGLWEIPTLPSTREDVTQGVVNVLHELEKIDFQGISTQLNGLLGDVRQHLDAMQLGATAASVRELLERARTLLDEGELRSALGNLNSALNELSNLGKSLNSSINPLLAQASTDLESAGTFLEEAVHTLREIDGQVQPSSPLNRELVRALSQARETLVSLRQLIEQIERNPSSLITGKEQPSE